MRKSRHTLDALRSEGGPRGQPAEFSEFERLGWEDSDIVKIYDEHLSCVTTQLISQLLHAAGIQSGAHVLDIATGGGYVASAASAIGADAIGIDFSTAMIKLGRERYPLTRFEQADEEALPFAAESFDAVVSAFGICRLPNPDSATKTATSV